MTKETIHKKINGFTINKGRAFEKFIIIATHEEPELIDALYEKILLLIGNKGK